MDDLLDPPRRKHLRLKNYDYSVFGAYFVTVCTQNRVHLLDPPPIRIMIQDTWDNLQVRFSFIHLDEFIIMPNHIHGIIWISDDNQSARRGESCIRPKLLQPTGDHKDRPYGTLTGSLGRVVQAFKSISTNRYIQGVKSEQWRPFSGKLWQRDYYEHVIRNDRELIETRTYIQSNSLVWEYGKEIACPW